MALRATANTHLPSAKWSVSEGAWSEADIFLTITVTIYTGPRIGEEMAAVLNIDTECLARLEQYEDDSVEAWFTDGTKISMAACGGAFTRQAKPKTGPDPFGRLTSGETSTLHQFTAYAARECRERVRALLAFRNLFAEQPFLPSSLLIKEIEVSVAIPYFCLNLSFFQVSGCAVDYGVWPLNLRQATGQNLFETNSTGGTRLQASDGRAWAEMAGHGQTLTTCYPARLSGGRGSRSDERESLEDCLAGLELKRNRGEVREETGEGEREKDFISSSVCGGGRCTVQPAYLHTGNTLSLYCCSTGHVTVM